MLDSQMNHGELILTLLIGTSFCLVTGFFSPVWAVAMWCGMPLLLISVAIEMKLTGQI